MQESYGRDGRMQFSAVARSDAQEPPGFDYKTDPSLDPDVEPVGFLGLFRYADKYDYLLLGLGLIFAMANGVGLVFYSNPFGDLTEAFAPGADPAVIVQQTKKAMYSFLKNAAVVLVASWAMSASWAISSERQSIRCRIAYLSAILRQEPGWHERQKSTQIAQKMLSETLKLQTAIGSKCQTFLMGLSLIVGGLIIALMRGWKLAAILMSFIPVMLGVGLISNFLTRKTDAITDSIGHRLSGNALEVLENVRTVKMLGGESYEISRFQKTLHLLHDKLIRYHALRDILGSFHYFCVIMNYTLGFWLGSYFVSRSVINDNSQLPYSVGDVIVIFFTIYISNLNAGGQLPQCIQAFEAGSRSAARIGSVIDRQPLIVDGENTLPIVQSLSFQGVTFRYEGPLFQNLNIQIRKGRTAFVGESGSGKSTIVSLIMRFYDPLLGAVKINGQSLRNFRLRDLKDCIGYVGQEPVLLGQTLREALVAEGYTDDSIVSALKAAEAYEFVREIGLDVEYGQLSGGQKQRIAIARALLKQPQILILDEATSALDRRNQKQIQATIDRLQVPFVVMIAHKIQTIAKADWIYVLDRGQIVQEGTYSQLMQQTQGKFYQLSTTQSPLQSHEHVPEVLRHTTEDSRGQLTDEEIIESEGETERFKWQYFWSLFSMNRQYLPLLLMGLLAAMYIGCIFPLFSYYIAQIVVLLSNIRYSPQDQQPAFIDQSQQLAIKLLIISVAGYFICYLRGVCMKTVQQRLIQTLKYKLFDKLLRMSMTFFDQQGSCTALLGDCNKAAALATTTLFGMAQNIAAMVLGLALAFYHCWQITLVSFALFPVLLIAGRIQMQFTNNYSTETDEANKRCHQQVVEALLNYKTVVSFNLQDKFIRRYEQLLEGPLKIAIKRGNITGLAFGVAQAAMSCVSALIFYLGAIFIRDYQLEVLNIYTAIYAIMFASISAGGNLGFVNNIADSKVALANIMKVLLNQDMAEPQGGQTVLQINGKVEFREVGFSYPLRKGTVLDRISFQIKPGCKVAIVGPSGCGKSTIVALLLRLYEPSRGTILIDGKPISQFSPLSLRQCFGVVSQQPDLFNRTIYENIRYNQWVDFQSVLVAAKQANAYDFISEGNFGVDELANSEQPQFEDEKEDIQMECFERKVGNRGSFLSGGQKQRVAIARALIRRPRILLLDQATSALDGKNEQEVQATLDSISGETQIIIAHRLSAIRRCDLILVLDRGSIVEQGTFQELLSLRGSFYRLAMGQSSQH